jgi:hypothetical protein
MTNESFNQNDLRIMSQLGISESRVRGQIEVLQRSSGYLRLYRSSTLGDGIHKISETEIRTLIQRQEEAAREGRFIKFIPASGAATRMFQSLVPFYLNTCSMDPGKRANGSEQRDPKAGELARFMAGIDRFAFFEDLKKSLARDGWDINTLIQKSQWPKILEYLLTERGLNYLSLPKGLHKFHTYPGQARTAFEEHLVEAVHILCDGAGQCRLHITVAPEHEDTVRSFFESIRPDYEGHYQCRFILSFSSQAHSTDTMAVDLENKPFRTDSGDLLFRPGGHGALLKNLNDLQGDLIYLKNIDNVLPDRLKEPTIIWKKVLGGYLVKIQQTVHDLIRKMKKEKNAPALLSEIMTFCQERLLVSLPPDFKKWSLDKQEDFLFGVLNRPIRICGMVKNEGEPGGGPFWVKNGDGGLSLQIVEGAQIDPDSAEQLALWASSTHFNPVDLVCAVRDYEGRPFDLDRYKDSEAVFICRKSQNGRELKALELPGLWNGSMARWITLFVEVPDQTFSPVKTVDDLLRPEHQPLKPISSSVR